MSMRRAIRGATVAMYGRGSRGAGWCRGVGCPWWVRGVLCPHTKYGNGHSQDCLWLSLARTARIDQIVPD